MKVIRGSLLNSKSSDIEKGVLAMLVDKVVTPERRRRLLLRRKLFSVSMSDTSRQSTAATR